MANVSLKSIKDARKNLDKMARENGLSENYLYLTTLKRLDVQLRAIDELEKAMESEPPLIEKFYVKDHPNKCLNPVFDGFNKCVQQANNTTQSLIKMIRDLSVETDDDDEL